MTKTIIIKRSLYSKYWYIMYHQIRMSILDKSRLQQTDLVFV